MYSYSHVFGNTTVLRPSSGQGSHRNWYAPTSLRHSAIVFPSLLQLSSVFPCLCTVLTHPGASSGYGMGIALAFAREGATVINSDLNPPPSTETIQDTIVFRKHDVTSRQQWDDVFAFAKEKYGGVDILVNNAGTSYRNKVCTAISRMPFVSICVPSLGVICGDESPDALDVWWCEGVGWRTGGRRRVFVIPCVSCVLRRIFLVVIEP